MKIKLNIKSIIFMTIIAMVTLLFINISFAANTGKVVVETAKLREQANTDSKVLELASLGEEVEILNEEEDWYKVKYKNITGYIRKDLIEVENKEAANTTNKNETTEENNKNTTENTNTENTITENNTTTENTTASETANNNETKTEEVAENEKVKLAEDEKLKIIPLISSIELYEVKKDEVVEIVERLNDWAKIKTSDGREGWMISKRTNSTGELEVVFFLVDDNDSSTTNTENNTTNTTTEQQTKTMYVNSQTVNLREKADKTSQALKQLTINTKVTVMSTENGWSYVDVNGTKGYIAEKLLSSTTKETSRSGLTTREQAATKSSTTTNSTTTENTTTASTKTKTITESTSTSQTGNSVVSYAKQFLGCKYVYGGTSSSGFDCSGFTQYVYKNFGVNLNRTAAAQYSNGQSVTSLQAGDLVMFGKSGINHVGIYIGGNSFIHAANKSQGVRIDTLSTGYYKTNYVGARRIF